MRHSQGFLSASTLFFSPCKPAFSIITRTWKNGHCRLALWDVSPTGPYQIPRICVSILDSGGESDGLSLGPSALMGGDPVFLTQGLVIHVGLGVKRSG